MRTRPKVGRRANVRTQARREGLAEIVARYDAASVRQIFYQAVAAGLVEKTERAYKSVSDSLVQMRRTGEIPWEKIVDGNRPGRIASSWDGVQDILDSAAQTYRRNLWTSQSKLIELWCEKDALTGILEPIAEEYGIPYVATRGFSSVTLIQRSGSEMEQTGKPVTVLYLGDHDASGVQIDRTLAAELPLVTFKRLALLPRQVKTFRLPSRPGKKSDSRHAGFVKAFGSSASVELDALPPNELAGLVRKEIERYVDPHAWKAAQRVEELERETLAKYVAAWPHFVQEQR